MKKWTDSEIEYLKNNYAVKTNQEISNTLRRSNKSLSFMSWKLGLRKDYEVYCKSHKHNARNITKEILEEFYFSEGKSIRKIAKELGLGKNTIAYYFDKFNIHSRNTSEANKNFYSRGGTIWRTGLTKNNDKRILLATEKMKQTWKDKFENKISEKEKILGEKLENVIKRLYWDEKLTQEKISEKLGLSRLIIIELMRKFNIKKRPNFEYISSLKGNKHSMYGKKWEKVYGTEGAKIRKEQMSNLSRKNIIRRLAHREMPFKDTSIERAIEKELTKRKMEFVPQFPIDNKFVCDFAIPKHRIIIECDGDYWHANPRIYNQNNLTKAQLAKIKTDKFKDLYLSKNGWIVLRFFESDIKKSVSKCVDIVEEQIKRVVNPLDGLK